MRHTGDACRTMVQFYLLYKVNIYMYIYTHVFMFLFPQVRVVQGMRAERQDGEFRKVHFRQRGGLRREFQRRGIPRERLLRNI